MTPRHLVQRVEQARYLRPTQPWARDSAGFTRWSMVDESGPAVHTGFGVCALEPGGSVPGHLHSYEESVFVLDGTVVLELPEGSYRLVPGDYGLLPVGVPHALRNDGDEVVRWADMLAPQPRDRYEEDTVLAPVAPAGSAEKAGPAEKAGSVHKAGPVEEAGTAEPVEVDVRDPRNRLFGHVEPASMDVRQQTQDRLAVSASMRTALLVYSGITVKMMVDSDLGAQLQTMFMVQYDPAGVAGPHDHPFEETYLFLEGAVEATFDGERYQLGPGDVAFAGVGCVHGFRNLGDGPLRWLETQAPQPPGRHSYRFLRDWDYLRRTLG